MFRLFCRLEYGLSQRMFHVYLRQTHVADALLEEASVTSDLFPMLFRCSLCVCSVTWLRKECEFPLLLQNYLFPFNSDVCWRGWSLMLVILLFVTVRTYWLTFKKHCTMFLFYSYNKFYLSIFYSINTIPLPFFWLIFS